MLLEKKKKNTFVAENAENTEGEMLEWLKRHAWKACIRQKSLLTSPLDALTNSSKRGYSSEIHQSSLYSFKIGRASCRERV